MTRAEERDARRQREDKQRATWCVSTWRGACCWGGQRVAQARGAIINPAVTWSSAGPPPVNKPLRWTAFSLILFLWNSLVCWACAFFCRMTEHKQKKTRQSRLWLQRQTCSGSPSSLNEQRDIYLTYLLNLMASVLRNHTLTILLLF